MNRYGYAAMMNDYVFLEDVGRKVGEWGREIGGQGLDVGVNVNVVQSGRGGRGGRGGVGGRGGRGGRGRGRGDGTGKSKRDILKMELEARDITVDLLPTGMERRKANQSSWDFKYVYFLPVLIVGHWWLTQRFTETKLPS
jgi:hypothetical protein